MVSKYREQLKQYILENHGESMVDFFENTFIPNENRGYQSFRSYSCDRSCPPWLNIYYNVFNKYMRYCRNIKLTKSDIRAVIDRLYADPELNRKLKDKLDTISDYEIKTAEFNGVDEYVRMLIPMMKRTKYLIA